MKKEIEQISLKIVCPVCNKSISEIWIAKMDSVIGIRYAYICCKCDHLLKISKERFSDSSINSLITIQE
ncbi:MAG: hypothetical protein ROY99_04740 [Ignavibacterium sp.]|jgi:hypothetical protein|nr:hypothetical protein [Ignavibacterium sp.]